MRTPSLRPRRRRGALLLAVAALLAPAASAGAQLAPGTTDAAAPRATPPLRTIASVRPDERIRLVTTGLMLGPEPRGASTRASMLVGSLVRIDSTPSLFYVVRSGSAEWSVPRSAVSSAHRLTGYRSRGRGAYRSAAYGALAGGVLAFVVAQAAGSDGRQWGQRLTVYPLVGAAAGLGLGYRAAREEWEPLELPPMPAGAN